MNAVRSPGRSGRTAPAQGGAVVKKETKASVEDKNKILSSAKSNFLNSTNQVSKSPLKRSSTPSPEKTKHLKEHLLSPTSLKKAGVCSPPKKKAKLWKSKWQLATLSGEVTGTGRRKKASEASRLLDDEGVIQMLDRVPNVYGHVPKVTGASNSRMARARTAANKAIKTSTNQQNNQKQKQIKKEKVVVKEEKLSVEISSEADSTQSPKSSPVFVKLDKSPSKIQDMPEGVLSPRRASRQASGYFQHVRNLVKEEPNSSLIQSEDVFSYLRELPADVLDSVTNCDIRYSLPSQGLPSDPRQEGSKSGSTSTNTSHQAKASSSKPAPSSSTADLIIPSKIKKEPVDYTVPVSSTSSSAAARYQPQPGLSGDQRLVEVQKCLQNDRQLMSPIKSPGAFSHIYVRLYENFAQVTFSPGKSKFTSSLGPAAIDEIIQLINFVQSTRMYNAILFTGLGGIFCQGVDLYHLIHNNPERRKVLASEMANAIERLILTLVSFSKTLVAAVNGEAVGLGLAILPLCDIVYASDKASFRSYSTRLGHIAEGGLSISLERSSNSIIRELILLGREVTAGELYSTGLIGQIFIGGRLMEETIPRVRQFCGMTNSAGMQANKLLFNIHLREQMKANLPAETKMLTETWATKDYNKNLVNFITESKTIKLGKKNA